MLTPLDSTLTTLASASRLTSTLTRPSRKSIKTRDFNPIRCHTYEGSLPKPCRINTYKKQGVGEGVPQILIFRLRRARQWTPLRSQIRIHGAANEPARRDASPERT